MTYDKIKSDVLTIFWNAHETSNKKLWMVFKKMKNNQNSEKVCLRECFGAYTSWLQFRRLGKSL